MMIAKYQFGSRSLSTAWFADGLRTRRAKLIFSEMMMIATVLPLVAAWSNLLGDSNMGKAIANMLQGSLSFNEQRDHRHIESESDEDAAENTPGADAEINKQLKYSIVRFMTEVKQLSLLKPWQLQGRQVFAGTGFAIRSTDNGPLIVTNAHVVTDADNVMIQIPAYGSQEYKARVVMLNPDMDIALAEFQPGEHKKFVDEVKKDIPILDFYTKPVNLATPVVALGFPLGQKTAKLTTGVISGHEKVGDYMSFQQTASISPGNSGGRGQLVAAEQLRHPDLARQPDARGVRRVDEPAAPESWRLQLPPERLPRFTQPLRLQGAKSKGHGRARK